MVIECFAQLERVARKMTIKHMGDLGGKRYNIRKVGASRKKSRPFIGR